MAEIWVSPPGFSQYRVSTLGRVGRILPDGTLRLLSPHKHVSGYIMVGIVNDDSKSVSQKVHRLVALTFIPNPENKPIVDHINKDRADNRLENLRWATPGENGQNKKKAKKHQTREIVQFNLDGTIHKKWNSMTDATLDLGITRYLLHNACINGTELEGYYWRDLSSIPITGEEWKPLTIYECNIMVSSIGRVRLLTGTLTYGHEVNNGYRAVHIGNKTIVVHRLVCMAFKPIDNYEKYEVNHIDFNRQNNRVENLEWVTPSQNVQHSKNRMNLKCHRPVLQFTLDGNLIAIYKSLTQASNELGISKAAIRNACDGRSRMFGGYRWQYVGEQS